MARRNCCGGGGGDVNLDDLFDGEHVVLCDKAQDGSSTPFMRHVVYDAEGNVDSTNDTELDGTTAYTPVGDVDVCAGDQYSISLGWYEQCEINRGSVNIQNSIDVSDNTANPRTLTFETIEDLAVFENLVSKHLEVNSEQTRVGVPLTTIVLTTSEGDYEFTADNITYDGLTVEIPVANVITWQANGVDEDSIAVTSDQIIACNCREVELIQRYNAVTNNIELIKIVYSNVDENNVKEEVDLPLGLGEKWGFGQCREERVVSIEPLCCTDDIESTNPDVFGQFFVNPDADGTLWQDLAMTVPAVDGGLVRVIESNSGGVNFNWVENPAINNNFDTTPPTLQTNRINGRPVVEFDGVSDALVGELPAETFGEPFTLVFLYSAANPQQFDALFTGQTGTPTAGVFDEGTYQISIGNNNPAAEDYNLPDGELTSINSLTISIVDGRVDSPTGFVGYGIHITDAATAYNGAPHVITMRYDGRFLDVYFDGNRTITKWDILSRGGNIAVDNGVDGLVAATFFLMTNRGAGNMASGTFMEFVFTEDAMSEEDLSYVNGYLICKWDVDASQVAGNVPLNVPVRAYGQPTEFVRRVMADGTIEFVNTITDRVYVYPPYGGLAYCRNSPTFVSSLLPTEELDFETVLMSDNGNIPFLRTHVYNSVNPDVVIDTFDTDLAGNPFIPAQPVKAVVGARTEETNAIALANGATWNIPFNTTSVRARAMAVAGMQIEYQNGVGIVYNFDDGWIEFRSQDGSRLVGGNFEITGQGIDGCVVQWTTET